MKLIKYKTLRFMLLNRTAVAIFYIALVLLLIPVLYWAANVNPTVGTYVFGFMLVMTLALSWHIVRMFPEFNEGAL